MKWKTNYILTSTPPLMYFLFQDRLVTISQIKKTFEENHGDIFPQIIIEFEF